MNIVSEHIFLKTKGNALTNAEFTDYFSNNEISEIFIGCADAIACVKSTCCNLRKAEYKVNVLSDCITSYDKRKIDEMLGYYESIGCRDMCLHDLTMQPYSG